MEILIFIPDFGIGARLCQAVPSIEKSGFKKI
jgi:hypothetical protein